MKTRHFILACVLNLSLILPAKAQDCERVLIPSVTKIQESYSSAQAYTKVHAEYVWESFHSEDKDNRGLDAIYNLFQIELNKSTTATDFRQRIERRFTQEGFTYDTEQSKAIYKSRIEDYQVSAWVDCIRQHGENGKLLISTGQRSGSSIEIIVQSMPRSGLGSENIEIIIDNGANEDGQTRMQKNLEGRRDMGFLLHQSDPNRPILVIANGLSSGTRASLKIPATQPDASPPPAQEIEIDATDYFKPDNIRSVGDAVTSANTNAGSTAYWRIPASGGNYRMQIEFASLQARPVAITISSTGNVQRFDALQATTSGNTTFQLYNAGTVYLSPGVVLMQITRGKSWPHIRKFIFTPVD